MAFTNFPIQTRTLATGTIDRLETGFVAKGAPIYITTSGTYTPSAGTRAVLVRVQGAGGPGGRAEATGATECAFAGGGGSGAYAEKFIISPAAATVAIGAAGIAGASPTDGGATAYGDGTNTITANGGLAGVNRTATAAGNGAGSNGGGRASATGGDLNVSGNAGFSGVNTGSSTRGVAGRGADSLFGAGGPAEIVSSAAGSSAGADGSGFGSGGSGAGNGSSQTTTPAGDGAPGIVIIQEYQ